MKKILLKYLNLYVLSGLLLVGFAGCSDDKDNDPVNPGPDVEELPSIGTYSFRGEANRIVSGEATIDGGYFTCIFSPEKIQDGKTSTYFLFSLGMYWEGQVVDASTLYQNDQYFFIYEDKSTRREKSRETRCYNPSQERTDKHKLTRFMPAKASVQHRTNQHKKAYLCMSS